MLLSASFFLYPNKPSTSERILVNVPTALPGAMCHLLDLKSTTTDFFTLPYYVNKATGRFYKPCFATIQENQERELIMSAHDSLHGHVNKKCHILMLLQQPHKKYTVDDTIKAWPENKQRALLLDRIRKTVDCMLLCDDVFYWEIYEPRLTLTPPSAGEKNNNLWELSIIAQRRDVLIVLSDDNWRQERWEQENTPPDKMLFSAADMAGVNQKLTLMGAHCENPQLEMVVHAPEWLTRPEEGFSAPRHNNFGGHIL